MTRRMKNISAALIFAGAMGFSGMPSYSTENKALMLGVDKAKLFRMETPASTVIIGNPTIADVTIQDGTLLVFTGKNFGATNVIILDENDKEIAEFDVSVSAGSAGSMTVFKGTAKASYNCSPTCESSLSVGDNKANFDLVKKQMEEKTNISKNGTSGEPPTDQ